MINSLYTAQSGLFTSRYAIDTTANNIANENTQGYKKRVVLTSEINLEGDKVGNGVSFDGVSRTTNQYLFNQLVTQTSQQSYLEQEDELLSQIEILFSETESSGLSISLSDYFESIENLRSDPNNEIYKSDFENQATVLQTMLQDIYSDLEKLEEQMFAQLENEVDTVNELVEQIAYLNEQIIKNSDASDDLLDKRDQLELELSTYGDIEVETSGNNYTLKMGGSTVIFNGINVHEITIEQDNGNTALKVYNNTLDLEGGTLKSLSNTMDEETSSLYSIMHSLDDFANALMSEINANSTTPLYSGDSVMSMQFDASAINDLSSEDLENLAQIQWGEAYAIDSTSTSTTSFSQFYQDLRVEISSKVENNAFLLDAQETVVQSIQNTYENQTKVDSDEEMINLLQYQAAYEANAKVITVVDEMLETLLNL